MSPLLKLIYRIPYHLVVVLCVLTPLSILGKILTLPVFMLMKDTDIALPRCLKWFDLADNWPEAGREDSTTYKEKIIPQGWWARYTWTQWRNPVNYFQYMYLGAVIHYEHLDVEDIEGNLAIYSNNENGWYYIELKSGYYEYLWQHNWTFLPGRRIVLRMGHKLMALGDSVEHVQFVASIMPFDS